MARYEYTYLGDRNNDDTFAKLDSTHYNLGCTWCHNGKQEVVAESIKKDDLLIAMEEAHADMITDPTSMSNIDNNANTICGGCHNIITDHNENSMHSQLWGEQFKIAQRLNGTDLIGDCSATAQSKFAGECMSCHTTCGQCHVSRPNTVHAGLLNRHAFQKTPDMTNNCTACHGSRIGKDFFGELEGNVPDVHMISFGVENKCLQCHNEDFHGDGTEFANPPQSRYEVNNLPTCQDCHQSDSDDNLYHQQHWANGNSSDGADVSCFVCHSQNYVNCDGCHTQGQWKEGYAETGTDIHEGDGGYYREYPDFKIGINPSYLNPNSEYSPSLKVHSDDKWILLRHIPISDETYDNWGVEQNNFSSLETWEYTSPHNIQRWTAQTNVDSLNYTTETCGTNCHVHGLGFDEFDNLVQDNWDDYETRNLSKYLIEENIITDDIDANSDVIVRTDNIESCGVCH